MIKHSLLFIFTRTITVLILLGVILYSSTNYKEALSAAKLKTLNRVMPSNLGYMIDINRNNQAVDTKKLDAYVFYYHTVETYVAETPDGTGIYDVLGYLYARLENRDKALYYFNKSAELNPHFFWTQYNLGVLYLHNGQYELAREHLMKALQSKPEIAVAVFSRSKIYQQLFAFMDDPSMQLQKGIEQGYKDGYRLLVYCNKILQTGMQPPIAINTTNTPLYLF